VTFFADEGVERQIIERLRLGGHRVACITEMSPGITDEVVPMRSQTSARVLITSETLIIGGLFLPGGVGRGGAGADGAGAAPDPGWCWRSEALRLSSGASEDPASYPTGVRGHPGTKFPS